jgi:hypothetical protein
MGGGLKKSEKMDRNVFGDKGLPNNESKNRNQIFLETK